MRPPDLNRLAFLVPFIWGALVIPRWLQQVLGVPVALALLALLRRSREGILANLRRTLPREEAARSFGLRVRAFWTFYHYGMYLLDYVTLAAGRRGALQDRLGRREGPGLAALVRAVRERRGAIIVTPHLGNWEVGGALLAEDGHAPLVVEGMRGDAALQRYRRRFRRSLGIEVRTLDAADATSPLHLVAPLETLRRGGVVAMLADRAGPGRSFAVPFFGARQRFPAGPAALSQTSGAPVFPVAITLGKGFRYRLFVDAPMAVPETAGGRAGRDAALERATAAMAASFERAISRAPDQWYNFFPFFEMDRAETSPWTATDASSSASTAGFSAAASATPA